MPKEYKADEFVYFIEEPTGEFEETGAKGGARRRRPITKKIIIDYDKIDDLDLEKRGEQVPFTHKHVVNTPLYMLYYWSPVIGDRACWLYIQLLSYCREEKDFLWDKLDELEYRMKMSRPTLNKNLDILEENNFILKIHRLNKLDNHRQTSPIIKVRQTVPLLSLEQYSSLSESGKKHHDTFIERYGKHTVMEESTYNASETIGELTEGGKVKVTQKMKKKVNKLLKDEKAIHYIATKLEFAEELKIEEYRSIISEHNKYFSKAMYDMWMQDSFIFYNKKGNEIDVVINEVAKQVFNMNTEMYDSKFIQIVRELYGMEYGDYKEINYYTYEEYMYKIERGIYV